MEKIKKENLVFMRDEKEIIVGKAVKGKRVHCRHLKGWHRLSPSYCRIGKDVGPSFVNCITCKYIDGYIEEYDPDKESERIVIPLKELHIMKRHVQKGTQPDCNSEETGAE
jgi:hypothetical protein